MTRASDLAKLIGAGATILDGTTISTADNTSQLILTSTDADSSSGGILEIARDSASPADGDAIGQIKFTADNDAGQSTLYGTINGTLRDASDGTEDGQMQFSTMVNGSTTDFFRYGVGGDGEIGVIFNEGSIDADFRVESNNDANAFFVEGSTGNIGIGTNGPAGDFHLTDASDIRILFTSDQTGNTSSDGTFIGLTDGGVFNIRNRENTNTTFYTNNTERMRIVNGGNVLVGTTDQSPAEGTGVGVRLGSNGTSQFSSSGDAGLSVNRTSDNGNVMTFRRDGNLRGRISVDGSSTSYITSSDYRLKENVVAMADATTRLKQLQPKRFNFISDADKTVDGFLAHEVQTVVPEAIDGEKDATNEDGSINPQGIDQSKLVPLLVKTIQELEARIVALETV